MDIQTFNGILEEFMGKEISLLTKKRSEYAGDEDVLINFKQVAAWLGVEPEQYCMTLIFKHLQSVFKAVNGGVYTWEWEIPGGGEGMKQRISDLRNYFMLLGALLSEKSSAPTIPSDPLVLNPASRCMIH